MALRKFVFQPGLDKDGTAYSAEGRWFESDKVRFRRGRPQTIGGWVKYLETTFLGVCRALFDWVASTGGEYLAVGTHLKYYVNEGSRFYDITPIRTTISLGTNPLTTTNGSTTVLVTTPSSHGAVVNDFVTLSGFVSSVNGIPAAVLNDEFQVVGVPETDEFEIEVAVPATSSGVGGGAGIEAEFQINTGLVNFVSATGWGVPPWGTSGWGSSTALSPTNQLRLYSQDAFGNDLVFCVRGGGVYLWDWSSGTSVRGVALSDLPGAIDAPTAALFVNVSEVDRHVICYGVNPLGSGDLDPLLIRWSDRENVEDWRPTATNTSGGQRLSTGSFIVGFIQTRQETLIWTDAGIESMRFIGGDFVFETSVVNRGISIIAPFASANANGVVYFMDRGAFYLYNGAVQPIDCPVQNDVFDNLNLGQAFKIFAAANEGFNEVTWFYPVGSGATEVTNYVTFNYLEGVWTLGTFDRTTWTSAPSRRLPIAAGYQNDEENFLFEHETGYDADGEIMNAYIETADFDLDDGDRFMFVDRIIPDIAYEGGSDLSEVNIVIRGRDYPLEDKATLSTSAVTPTDRWEDIRLRSRQISIRYETGNAGFGWRLGDIRLNLRPDGRK